MAFIESRISNRTVIVALVAAGLLAIVSRLVLSPAFHAATGFIPFDEQFPLSPEVIAIQLGAINRRAAAAAYVPFAVSDFIYAAVAAWAFTIGWAWIFARAPNRLFSLFVSGGVLFIPLLIGALDIAENVGFLRLMRGVTGASYASTIETTATIHGVRASLAYARDYLTGAILIVAVVVMWLQRRSRKASP